MIASTEYFENFRLESDFTDTAEQIECIWFIN